VTDEQHLLVTGGAGFIGSHLVDAILARHRTRVTVLDRLSAGGTIANLEQHDGDPRLTFVRGDVRDADLVAELVSDADAVIHAAAETHVDRSIDEPGGFLATNVMGTHAVLDAVRAHDVRMLMISTDEVYGSGDPRGGSFTEDDPLRPRSPYAASKAAADLLCAAYATTYATNVTVVRGTNAFGPRQIERVVPTYALNALRSSPVPVYDEGKQRREFLFVTDWVEAAMAVLERGAPGEVVNIGAGHELENIQLARKIVALVGAPEELIEFVVDRPGHDFRYGVDPGRLLGMGWRPRVGFDEGLSTTVEWYRDHLEWLERAHEVPVVTAPRPIGADR
jgi:dTDP-glucose 4,6-dehydratase